MLALTVACGSFSFGSGSTTTTCPGGQILFYCGAQSAPTTVTCKTNGDTPANGVGTATVGDKPCATATVPQRCKGAAGTDEDCEAGNSTFDGASE